MAVQMQVQERLYTADDLWELSREIEDDRRLELIEGDVVDMPPPGDRHGVIAMEMGRLIANHVIEADLGEVAAEAGFILNPNTVCAPDVAFLSKARLTPMTGKYYPTPPDLAVEVVSPNDSARQIRQKVGLYLAAGVRLVWVIYPDERAVDVYRPDAPPAMLDEDGMLEGGDVLPGFSVAVGEVFKRVRE